MDYLIIICLVFVLVGVKPPRDVKVTVYHIRGITASGEHTDKIKEPFIAISRDLLAEYPLHTKVRLYDCPFEGDYIIKDKMNKRMKNMVDIFLPYTGRRYNSCSCKLQTVEEFYNPTIIEEHQINIDSIEMVQPIDSLQIGNNK